MRTLLLLLLVCCGKPRDEPPPAVVPRDASIVVARDAAVAVAPPARRLWIPRIDDAATFDSFSNEIGGERFAKFVIDLKSDAVYYFDVDVYKVHKDFIFQELYRTPKTKAAVRVFDKNYGPNKTDFMMIYLVHHLAQDLWTFAFWDGDRATAEHVRHAYRRMKETFYLGDKVKFRPDSNYQEGVARTLKDVPVIFNDQLYQAATYQPFNKGIAIGKLRVIPAGVPESELTFDPEEIVILHAPLADITPVAGIISEQFSTPLAHVSLRARGWQIPNIGLKEAATKLAPLVGKAVYFEARDADYVIREATAAELAQHRAKAVREVLLPIANLAVTELADLEHMRAKDVVAYGTKAANLGEIVAAKLTGFEVPRGFGVPFHYYDEHMKQLGKQLAALLADPAFAKDPELRKLKLAALRKAIVEAPAPAELHDRVEAALGELTNNDANVGVFVRSSTNCEDLPTFSGAGLYDTIPNQKGTDAVITAIKQVWASVWNLGAYEDRALYHIAQTAVFGGVLVEVGINGTAAGVLVTTHPTDPTDERNYTINAKSGLGLAVVDGRAVPESLIVSWYNHGIRILSRSAEPTKLVFDDAGGVREVPNPDQGKAVLTNAMAVALVDIAHELTRVFHDKRLDIEWVFAGDQLYIVQTRPYVDH